LLRDCESFPDSKGKKDCKGHYAQAANLYKKQYYDLAKGREIFRSILYDEASYAGGGGSRKEGIYQAHPLTINRCLRLMQQDGSDKDND
jgi:hypothetical protein